MSLSLVMETEREVRRLLVAGSALASEDFRLKRLLPQMSAAGAKVPVFARVADGISKVVEAPSQESAASLLELATLVNAILYTQGQTGVTGEAEPVETAGLGYPTMLSLRKIKPLIEALTQKGMGRTEVIRQYADEGIGADIRLIGPLLVALGDGYAEIYELAEKLLIGFGPELAPLLAADFDMQGGKPYARRLGVLYQLAELDYRDLYLQALEQGDADIKLAALNLLKRHPDHEEVLLQAAKDRRAAIREAAYEGLGNCDSEAAADVLFAALHGKDSEMVMEPIMDGPSRYIMNRLIAEAEPFVEAMAWGKHEIAADAAQKGNSAPKLNRVLFCLEGRAGAFKEPEIFACLKQLLVYADTLKGIKVLLPNKEHLSENALQLVANALLLFGTEEAFALLEDAYSRYPDVLLEHGMEATLRRWPAAKVYKHFSPHLQGSRRTVPYKTVLRVIAGYVNTRGRERYVKHPVGDRYGWTNHSYSIPYLYQEGGYLRLRPDRELEWDERWLKLLAELGELRLVSGLVTVGRADRWCKDFLLAALDAELKKTRWGNEAIYAVLGLLHMETPDVKPLLLERLDTIIGQEGKSVTHPYRIEGLLDGISFMPADWAGDVEARANACQEAYARTKLQELADFLKTKGADGHE
jgi:hypothetical protein